MTKLTEQTNILMRHCVVTYTRDVLVYSRSWAVWFSCSQRIFNHLAFKYFGFARTW